MGGIGDRAWGVAAAVIVALGSPVVASDALQYFPPSALKPSFTCQGGAQLSAVNDFEARWYGGQWRAAHEPSLWEASQAPGAAAARRYRFTLLPSFSAPVIVRVDQGADGRMHLTAKRLSGKGGYDPGRVDAEIERFLTPAEQQEVERAISQTKVFDSAPRDCTMGLDGSQWILEANEGGAYRVVQRWSPQDGPVREVGSVFLKLTHWY